MRWLVALVAAAGILGLLCWLLRPEARGSRSLFPSPVVEEDRADGVELARHASPSSSEPGGASPAPSAEQQGHRSAIAPARSAPRASAPVRGRLVVAESGDPIAEVLSVRLRTVDLEHKEELLTLGDGTFTSAGSYAAGVLLARVKDRDGRELVDHEARFDPSAPEDWLVPVPSRAYPTFARGTVVDRRGDPLGEVPVRLLPLATPLPWVEAFSDEDGRFQLKDLRGGPHTLLLQGIWQRATLEVQLHAGANELGALVLDEPGSAGLLVRFVSPGGDWPAALVVVHPAASDLAVPFSSGIAEDLGRGTYELRLRVPRGSCTVTLAGLDGREYLPDRAEIEVPGELEIRVSGKAGTGRRLRARDASTGEPILAFDAWKRCHGVWGVGTSTRSGERRGDLFLLGADTWVVLAAGHRGRRGTLGPDEDDVVEVALERGWGELLVFEDAGGDTRGNPGFGRRRPLLAGVEVFVDGRFAGTSDADGMLLLSGDEAPRELTFRSHGWRIVKESRSRSLRQVWLARAP